MHQPLIIIPARLASTRLPNKPLALIHNKPMILHVWERAMAANVGKVAVACCGSEIAEVIKNAGGQAIITDPDLPSGTDRIWQAAQKAFPGEEHPIIVNLQGDLPTLPPELLKTVIEPLSKSEIDIATLAAPIHDPHEIDNPNVVKIALSPDTGRALYFSRSAIPYGAQQYYHHIGIYAYKRKALERFVSLPPSALEKTERLEQLRALENGMHIAVKIIDKAPQGVDTPEDLAAVMNEA